MNLDWLPFCRTSGRRRTDVRASHSDPSITHQALLVWQCALNSLRMHFGYNVVYWNNSVCCCACFYWYLSARTALWRCSNSCSTRTFQCRVVLTLVLGTEALVVAVEQRIQQVRHIGARSCIFLWLFVDFGVKSETTIFRVRKLKLQLRERYRHRVREYVVPNLYF